MFLQQLVLDPDWSMPWAFFSPALNAAMCFCNGAHMAVPKMMLIEACTVWHSNRYVSKALQKPWEAGTCRCGKVGKERHCWMLFRSSMAGREIRGSSDLPNCLFLPFQRFYTSPSLPAGQLEFIKLKFYWSCTTSEFCLLLAAENG